jgi:hypothetical protein
MRSDASAEASAGKTQPLAIHGELRRQLKQHRGDLRRQRIEARLHERDRALTLCGQPFPVGNEFRRLPGEHKVTRRIIAPCTYRFERGRAIERAVDLGGGEPACVVPKPMLPRHLFRIESATPSIVGPSGRSDPDVADCRLLFWCSGRGRSHGTGGSRAVRASKPRQRQAARRLTLLSARAVNFLSVAFSSSRFCCSTLAQSLRPSCLAQAIRLP